MEQTDAELLAEAEALRSGPPVAYSMAAAMTKRLIARGLSLPRQHGKRVSEPVDFDAMTDEARAQFPVVLAYLAEH